MPADIERGLRRHVCSLIFLQLDRAGYFFQIGRNPIKLVLAKLISQVIFIARD